MAFRHMVGILFIGCLIIFHADCAPRISRAGETVSVYGSGSGDSDDVGGYDMESSEEDSDNSDSDTRPDSPVDDGNEVDFGNNLDSDNAMDLGKGFGRNTPATTPVTPVTAEDAYKDEDLDSEELGGAYEDDYEDNNIDVSDEEKDPSENAFVSINNGGVGSGPKEKPLKPKFVDNDIVLESGEDEKSSGVPNERGQFFGKPEEVKPVIPKTEDDKPGSGPKETPLNPQFVDKDIELEFGDDTKSSGIPNERDQFFGKPEEVKPEIPKTEVSKVGKGVMRSDVMIVFDDDDYYDDDTYDEYDSQEGGSFTKGEYKTDDFFDTIGPKKLDDFIPKATETKKAQDFIDGRTTTVSNDIFGEISNSLGAPMKDDFFDSIADKNIVTLNPDLKLQPIKKDNKVGASVAKLGTKGPGNELTVEEEQKMKRLILQALQVFGGSACLTRDNVRLPKCAVLQDVLKALAISGMTFGEEKKTPQPIGWKRSWG